ncbi:MAG: Rrf2 family transcriptional regulator [Bacteroidales bacterium]|jgi:Rrf2 family transcriptional regulator, iron-sulfur cluster assembly transcription factor|nr:Rrf2 family transcriptional regulator [Bacteroidales bacterium]|tara:strand:+ start:2536 stop:2970 length:435 start_codon:yes stop_codon:yes gene_type:complete
MLSQKTKYALRAVLYLSVESDLGSGLKGGKDVSDALKMPAAYTGKILQDLARANVITSLKGPGGGFYISKQNAKEPLLNIVEIMGDLPFFSMCGLGLSQCSDDQPCPIHDSFKGCRDKLLDWFENKTISDLGDDLLRRELYLVV